VGGKQIPLFLWLAFCSLCRVHLHPPDAAPGDTVVTQTFALLHTPGRELGGVLIIGDFLREVGVGLHVVVLDCAEGEEGLGYSRVGYVLFGQESWVLWVNGWFELVIQIVVWVERLWLNDRVVV